MESPATRPAGHDIDGSQATEQRPGTQNQMNPPWNGETRARLIRTAEQALGRDLSGRDPSQVDEALTRRAHESGLNAQDYAARLETDPAEAILFWQILNNSHSVFFRNPLTFALLEQFALPALLQKKDRDGQETRVWSAGCAAGQEAYSLAILLWELSATRNHAPRVRIFATDHCAQNLTRARRGFFDRNDVQNVRLCHLRAHFSRKEKHYVIGPAVRPLVDFSEHDLLDARTPRPQASIFGEFDLIACCNVLLHYRPDIRRLILGRLHAALAPHGFLVVDEAERDWVTPSEGFDQVTAPGALFRKIPRQG